MSGCRMIAPRLGLAVVVCSLASLPLGAARPVDVQMDDDAEGDLAAVSVFGDARSPEGNNSLLAVSGAGDADSGHGGGGAVSVLGDARGNVLVLAPMGSAYGRFVVASLAGPATAEELLAFSLMGPTDGNVAASGSGPANGSLLAASVTGDARAEVCGASVHGDSEGDCTSYFLGSCLPQDGCLASAKEYFCREHDACLP